MTKLEKLKINRKGGYFLRKIWILNVVNIVNLFIILYFFIFFNYFSQRVGICLVVLTLRMPGTYTYVLNHTLPRLRGFLRTTDDVYIRPYYIVNFSKICSLAHTKIRRIALLNFPLSMASFLDAREEKRFSAEVIAVIFADEDSENDDFEESESGC